MVSSNFKHLLVEVVCSDLLHTISPLPHLEPVRSFDQNVSTQQGPKERPKGISKTGPFGLQTAHLLRFGGDLRPPGTHPEWPI